MQKNEKFCKYVYGGVVIFFKGYIYTISDGYISLEYLAPLFFDCQFTNGESLTIVEFVPPYTYLYLFPSKSILTYAMS